jgi:hypothetical protein
MAAKLEQKGFATATIVELTGLSEEQQENV